MLERMLRAGAAVLGGLALALDHLREPELNEAPDPVIVAPCPLCNGSLTNGPHFHDEDAVWPTSEHGVVLLTELDGTNAMIIPTSLPPKARPA